MISVQYISNLNLQNCLLDHTKIIAKNIPVVSSILLLLGNIGNPFTDSYAYFLKEMNKKFEKVFVITGTIEYQYNDINETNQKISELVKCLSNVSFLQNNVEDYLGIKWVGTTGWSRIDNPKNRIKYNVNKLSIDVYNELHQQSINFLQYSINTNQDHKLIILTHHIPSYSLIDAEYNIEVHKPYQQWYAAHFDDLIIGNENVIKGWFYGNTKKSFEGELYFVKMYCNSSISNISKKVTITLH